jgi:L,D-transpeptidase YcbB
MCRGRNKYRLTIPRPRWPWLLLFGLTLAGTAWGDPTTDALLRDWLSPGGTVPARVAELPSRPWWGTLYEARGYRSLWFEEGAGEQRRQQLREAPSLLLREGMDPQTLLPEWAGEPGEAVAADPEQAAILELRLTDALVATAAALYGGVTRPAALDPTWQLPQNRLGTDALAELFAGRQTVTALLDGLVPQQAEYRRLGEALAAYRTLAAAGDWETLPEGPTLRPGDSAPEVAILRRRLQQGGDLVPVDDETAPADLYDPALAEAVQRFQARHGLTEDAAVGPQTRVALNVPLAQRIAQLRATLERWRWMPRPQGDRFLLVNTAGFRLTFYEDGEPGLEMRVIVGLPHKKWATPSFTAPVRYLVLNPYWNIPRNILYDEVLPDALADPEYLERKRIRLLDESGDEVALNADELRELADQGDAFPYRLRQEAGSGNALGRLKLMLPNRYDIYLHDTNRRSLFQRSYRAFSHGCIRLEKPFALAARLLGGEWDEAKLDAAAGTAKNRTLNLPEPVPVYIVYLTAWMDADGTVQFRDDHYRREGPLVAAFQQPLDERMASHVEASQQAM